jgi:hypothetical protein
MRAIIDYFRQYDRTCAIVWIAIMLSALITFYAVFRIGAWLTYKSIEGHIEKKVTVMVSAEALKK